MTGWSDWRRDRVIHLDWVDRRGKVISTTGGEAKIVYEIAGMPGWLMKQYRPGTAISDARLDRLISLPERLDAAEKTLVHTATSWPVARVVAQSRSVGVVIPKASDSFVHAFRRPDGKWMEPKTVNVDQLCRPADELKALGQPVPSEKDRRATGRRLAEVGALFERHDLVYADWSYTNAFWNPQDGSVYVIDVDGCYFGTRPWIGAVNWDDPQVARGQPITTTTDRYRLGLLVARCLTGERGPEKVPAALLGMRDREPAVEVLLRMIHAGTPAEKRPTIEELAVALGAAARVTAPVPVQTVPATEPESDANVKNWKKVGPSATATTVGASAPPPPPPPRPPAAAPARDPSTARQPPPGRPSPARQGTTGSPTRRASPPRPGQPATRPRPARPVPRPLREAAEIVSVLGAWALGLGLLLLVVIGLARAL
ncbi:hypothetical protein [Pseudofrankia sp. EUN1h]|uniref:hypothetical protein n=1 Tax=Pseudofrankia sp. EUN1h TaxID=1834515 RepID=UPI0008D9503E|nr:hypothetical protein [Pseudofrankia sp. EUN1h]OHV35234.1 hypothetical protein BCD49_04530 [Pseudofrankia sp. EUN1h]